MKLRVAKKVIKKVYGITDTKNGHGIRWGTYRRAYWRARRFEAATYEVFRGRTPR